MAREVTPQIQRFIEEYMNSDKNHTELGEMFGVHRTTIGDWIKEYKEEIDVYKQLVKDRVLRKLQRGAEEAIEQVRVLATTGTPEDSVKLNASKTLLDKYLPTRSESEVKMTGNPIQVVIEEEKPEKAE